jgi:hypothetical protein
VLTAAKGGALGHGVPCVSSRVLASTYRLLFRCKNSDVSNSNIYIVINLIFRTLLLWLVCMYLCILASSRILR